MTVLRHAVAAAVVLLLCADVVDAQNGTFGFDGRIIVPDPHFDYPPIEVRLLRDEFDGRILAVTFTESTGSYAFKGLAEGSYSVFIRVDGYQDVRQRVDLTARDGFMHGVNIILKPSAPAPNANAASLRENREAIDAYGKALDKRARNDFDAAAKLMETVVKLVPEYADAHAELGEVYLQLHRRVDAERQFRMAYALNPGFFRAQLDLGRLYLEEAEVQIATGGPDNIIRPLIERAHDLLGEAAIRYPNSAMAQYLLGSADFRATSYESAESELKKALSLDSGMVPARILLINVFVVQKKWQNALDMLDKFIRENPASPYREEAKSIRSSVVRRLTQNP